MPSARASSIRHTYRLDISLESALSRSADSRSFSSNFLMLIASLMKVFLRTRCKFNPKPGFSFSYCLIYHNHADFSTLTAVNRAKNNCRFPIKAAVVFTLPKIWIHLFRCSLHSRRYLNGKGTTVHAEARTKSTDIKGRYRSV